MEKGKNRDLDKALNYANKSYQMNKRIFSEKHSETANSLELIANIFKIKADYDNAIKNYENDFPELTILRRFGELFGTS